MQIESIISEVRSRKDCTNISDEEILAFINDLDAYLGESVFPRNAGKLVSVTSGTYTYSISPVTEDQIYSVDVDGVYILKKQNQYDLIDGWYVSGTNLTISEDLLPSTAEQIRVSYRVKPVPHELFDSNLNAPESFSNLYVLWVLAQISAKDADSTSYENYKTEYNSLLSDAIQVSTRNQLFSVNG